MECLFLTGMYLLVVLDGAFVHSGDCGAMTVSWPVLKNRPVTVSLTPTPPVSQDNTHTAEWLVFYIDKKWRQPKNFTDEFDVNLTDGKYILTIKNTTREGSVDINFRLYNNAGREMCSQNKRIAVKVLKDCGLLHAPVSHVKEGQSAYLSYYPAMSMENYPDSNHTRTLYFTPTSEKENVTVQYFQTWDGDTLSYTIELPMFQSNMSGEYRIKCTPREQDWKLSSVNLQLAIKPSQPILQNVTTERAGCTNGCLVFQNNQNHLLVSCDVVGGTEPVNVTIVVDSPSTKVTPWSKNRYYADVPKAILSHGASVRCEVMNAALDEPLVTSATVFVIEQPSQPNIVLDDFIHGKEGVIRCSSEGMRPVSDMKISGIPCRSTNQTESHDNGSDTYSLKDECVFIANKSMNNMAVTCCVEGKYGHKSSCSNARINISDYRTTTTLQQTTLQRSGPTNPSLPTTTLQPETSNRTSRDITKQIWFWPAVGGGGGAVFIIIICFVIFVARKKNRKAENAVNAQDEGQPRDGGPAVQGEENDVTYAVPQKTNKGPPKKEVPSSSGVNKADANGPVGAAADGPVEAGDTAAGGDVYAVVIPRSERTIPTDKVQNPNQLVYAELELHTDPQPKNNPKEGVEITDYVTIDFNETK